MEERLTIDIISKYSPVYPESGNWEDTADLLYQSEPEHMAVLSESLRKHGWRKSIQLSLPDEEDGSTYVLNGTHRVAIALREGIMVIPTVMEGEESEGEYDDTLVAEALVQFCDGDLSEEDDTKLLTALRSFPISDEKWVESGAALGTGNRWTFFYESVETAEFAVLLHTLRTRLSEIFPNRAFSCSVKRYIPEGE